MKNLFKALIALCFIFAVMAACNYLSADTSHDELVENTGNVGNIMSMASMGGAVIIAPSRKRSIFSRLQETFAGTGLTIQESYLRVDHAITNGKNTYSFPLTPGNDHALELKLVKNDVFVITHIGLFLYKAVSGARASEVLQTYPNATYFPDGATFKAKFLNAFYQGRLAVKVQDKTFIESFDTKRFYQVPPQQQGSVTAIDSTDVKSTLALSPFNLEDALVEVDPNVYLNGDVQNTISLDVPLDATDVPANDNANTVNYVVLYTQGFLIKGGAAHYDKLLNS